ncbi:MAG TPA: histidine kinase dimerization/phospho-acceptor domain-containing protein, partial [Gemmatirosa sp.]
MTRPIRSIRVRLAAWHTLAVAVLLALFSGGTWLFLTRAAHARADAALADLTRAYVDAWAIERAERASGSDAATPGGAGAGPLSVGEDAHAAAEAVREFRYAERRVLVFDPAGRLVAASDTLPLTPALAGRAFATTGHGPVAALVAAARPGVLTLRTIDGGLDDAAVRASATRVVLAGAPFTVVALRSSRAEDEATAAFTEALVVAVPLALALAALVGYALTRASLAPVVVMAQTATRIGSGTLHERLPVLTPDDELGALATVFNDLLARVEAAFAQQVRAASQQRQFMADASHELRTPVTALTAVAEVALARADRSGAEWRGALNLVRDEGRRLGRIVEDLFLLARADAGQFPVRREPVYLEEILHASARAARAIAIARGVTLDVPPAAEAPFVGDPHLLGRLVLNLLDNAVKYTPAGGRVRATLGTVPRGAVDRGAYVLAVEDTGCGIAPE